MEKHVLYITEVLTPFWPKVELGTVPSCSDPFNCLNNRVMDNVSCYLNDGLLLIFKKTIQNKISLILTLIKNEYDTVKQIKSHLNCKPIQVPLTFAIYI